MSSSHNAVIVIPPIIRHIQSVLLIDNANILLGI